MTRELPREGTIAGDFLKAFLENLPKTWEKDNKSYITTVGVGFGKAVERVLRQSYSVISDEALDAAAKKTVVGRTFVPEVVPTPRTSSWSRVRQAWRVLVGLSPESVLSNCKDPALERWLHTEVVQSYKDHVADPSKAYPVQEMADRVHSSYQVKKKSHRKTVGRTPVRLGYRTKQYLKSIETEKTPREVSVSLGDKKPLPDHLTKMVLSRLHSMGLASYSKTNGTFVLNSAGRNLINAGGIIPV